MDVEQRLAKFREIEGSHRANVADIAQKIHGLPDGEKVRKAGAVLALSVLVDMKLEALRQKHYQQALDELRDIETSAKQAMNRLGQPGGGR